MHRIIEQMKNAGINFDAGLTKNQIRSAEKTFDFRFPAEIADFLRLGVPVGDSFFDFRDLSDTNSEKFRKFRKIISDGFEFDFHNDPCFLSKMEKRYGTKGIVETYEASMKELENSPKLIPFYSNRCFFDGSDNMPIISYAQPNDIIIYGTDFYDYLKNEFIIVDTSDSNEYKLPDIKNLGIWECLIRQGKPVIEAHHHCTNNKKEIKYSKECGCFHCLNIFQSDFITEWIDDGNTALCPFCRVDSVICGTSGYPVTKDFLKAMQKYWF